MRVDLCNFGLGNAKSTSDESKTKQINWTSSNEKKNCAENNKNQKCKNCKTKDVIFKSYML